LTLAAVVFDLFGTLVSSDPWREHDSIVAQMAEILQAPTDLFLEVFNVETRIDREVGRFSSLEENLIYVCRKIEVPLDDKRIARAAQLRRDFVAGALTLRPDAMSTLTQLKGMSLQLGLISDCSPEVPLLFTRTPLAPMMGVTVFSSIVGTKKPDPKMYETACRALNVEPQEVVYVGDGGSNELSGAQAYGMIPVLIRPPGEGFGDKYRPEALSWGGDSISRLSDLLDLMERRGWSGGD
jgi:putative hydrolase of the HAD superfamily